MPATILLVLVAVSLFCALATHAATHLALSRRTAKPRGPLPPITILKPLCGFDEDLDENLRSLAGQDYPAPIQIVLGAEDSRDPALDAARRLRARFPTLDVQIVHCDRPLGLNPKVNNLSALLARARFDVILVSDSNVRARPGYLRAIAAELVADSRVELVYNPVVGSGEKSAGAVLETLQLATFATAAVCASSVLGGPACVIGKSMLFRRSTLEKLGGLRAVRSVLAEDFLLGRRFERAGHLVALCPMPVDTVCGRWSVGRFLERHIRWGQLRRRMGPAFFAEPLLNPVAFACALLGFAALSAAGPARAATLTSLDGLRSAACAPLSCATLAAAAFTAIAIKAASDVLLLWHLREAPLRLRDLPLVPLKDLLALLAWSIALIKISVSWRGHHFRIGRLSRLTRDPGFGPGPLPDRRRAPLPVPPGNAIRQCVRSTCGAASTGGVLFASAARSTTPGFDRFALARRHRHGVRPSSRRAAARRPAASAALRARSAAARQRDRREELGSRALVP